MSFVTLSEDILLNILALCDVYHVLSVSAVNKSLRRITIAKQLWLSLIQDDAFRAVLDLPPPNLGELEGYSAEELIDLVKRLAIGPSPWWSGGISIAMPYYKEAGVEARLLPGARYLVLQSRTGEGLCMYDVWSGRLVWKCTIPSSTHWAIDLVPGTALVRAVLAVEAHNLGRNLYVEEIDLTIGESERKFAIDFLTRFCSLLGISGDFFLYSLPPSVISDAETTLVLVNWRARAYVVLNYGIGSNSIAAQVVLIPGYIIAAHPEDGEPPYHLVLTITDLDSLSPYWKSGISLRDQLSPRDIPFAVQERLKYNGRPLGHSSVNIALSVEPSAVYRGAYNILVYAGEFPSPHKRQTSLAERMSNLIRGRLRLPPTVAVARQVLLSYKLTPPLLRGQSCGWRLVSAKRSPPVLYPALSPRRARIVCERGEYAVSYCQF
ncbi:hypothetical protein MVEN_00712500 [Mycena venus]|uniref:F-box domain-containing protein n=1 Tax=Mycena venus TaxID=2733690 RepID=A0A8H6YL09_9AGAR|nr:hypothetical protein MVEN_00712500 [Mycena venus]